MLHYVIFVYATISFFDVLLCLHVFNGDIFYSSRPPSTAMTVGFPGDAETCLHEDRRGETQKSTNQHICTGTLKIHTQKHQLYVQYIFTVYLLLLLLL